ncbi:hypothetical protein D3C81_1891030 [compost metagenome]
MLTAGKAKRVLAQPVFYLVPQRCGTQRTFHRFIKDASIAHALQPQAVNHVFINRLRKGIRALEHHADPPSQRRNVDLRSRDALAVKL